MKIKYIVICVLAVAGVCLVVADADAGRAERQARRAARHGGGYSACGASSMQGGYSAYGPAQSYYPAPAQYSPPAQYYSAPTMSCPSGNCPVSVIESKPAAVETVQVAKSAECCCESCNCADCDCGNAEAVPVAKSSGKPPKAPPIDHSFDDEPSIIARK